MKLGPNIMKTVKEKLSSIILMENLMDFNHIGIQMVIKLKKKNYINGKQEGFLTKFFEKTGIKKEETFYKDGVQQGLWTEWYSDGQKKRERNFSGGERDSVWTTWYKNGNKKLQATYLNGKLNGKSCAI